MLYVFNIIQFTFLNLDIIKYTQTYYTNFMSTLQIIKITHAHYGAIEKFRK